MASHHDDDTMPEETQGYKLSQPKQSLAEYSQMVNKARHRLEMFSTRPPPPSLDSASPETQPFRSSLRLPAYRPTDYAPPGPEEQLLQQAYSYEPRLDLGAITLSTFILPSLKSRPIPSVMSPLNVMLRIDWAHRHRDQSMQPRRNHDLTNATTTDAGDESLQRYKQSLGLGQGKDLSDPNDPRVCIIYSLTMESPGRDPVKIDLRTPGSEKTLKDHPFKIKEGAKFTMVADFKVQHEILSGLHYVQVVKRKGIKVSKDSEMIGSYAPNTDKQPIYTKKFQEEEAPTGMLARGHYNAISSFVDDDKKKHLEFEWSFDIAKDW
ncbi:hypothetical protein PpBr36_01204 [Pyricularia pennisetigena]|uniref:hypothetical protein n=1 Tax=Pyricularia pennisetigena TaxID=1578925 RepID=UPI00114FFACF|nr:hypothetical protein PpBr36_01204 [Pyricularia pennisetigena]TLS27744.1 hypothetical protein PpBr36_01204 [Pyricularia pennisetigena]